MVGRHLLLGFRSGHIGAEYMLLRGRMTPFSSMESTISCTGSYDAIGILYWRTNVGGAFGFVGMHTVWMLVSPQSRESFAKESLCLCLCSTPWQSKGEGPCCLCSVQIVVCYCIIDQWLVRCLWLDTATRSSLMTGRAEAQGLVSKSLGAWSLLEVWSD